MLRQLRSKSTHASKHLSQPKSPLNLVGNRYNPPVSMSRRTAEQWAKVAEPKKESTKLTEQPVDLYGKIENPKAVEKYVVKERKKTVEMEDNGRKFSELTAKYYGVSEGKARAIILKGEVFVVDSAHSHFIDGKPDELLHAGDTIARVVRYKKLLKRRQIKMALEDLQDAILYKDERIMVINKPRGLAMHAGTKNMEFNLESLLEKLDPENQLRIVHRLDKDTTGCLILARTKEAAVELSEMFQSSEIPIQRRYLAMLVPPLDPTKFPVNHSQTITTGISMLKLKSGDTFKAVDWNDDFAKQDNEIKKAVTNVTVLKNRRLASLVALEPDTGRKHQLRVHCAQVLKAPILGDFKYSHGFTRKFRHQLTKRDERTLGLQLHLHTLRIRNWYRQEKDLLISAPLPAKFTHLMKSTGFDPMIGNLLEMRKISVPKKKKLKFELPEEPGFDV